MNYRWLLAIGLGCGYAQLEAADFQPAPQTFLQEIAVSVTAPDGTALRNVQCLDEAADNRVRAFAGGHWFELRDGRWGRDEALTPQRAEEFSFPNGSGGVTRVPLPWRDVKQLLRWRATNILATAANVHAVRNGTLTSLGWPTAHRVHQVAGSRNHELVVASSGGLFSLGPSGWTPVEVRDAGGRAWAVQDVLGVCFDSHSRLWFASRAGVGCRETNAWRFYEGKDGLPWNDFTGMASAATGDVWFATHWGAIRFNGSDWDYRQGPRWLPNDDVSQVMVDNTGRAWCATADGIGLIERKPMTLAAKAEWFETEIERHIQRTPFGYVAEAHLEKKADKSSANPQDSDNDGLWTAMYGAGECFAYAATHLPKAKVRAQKAFEALRFLQTVTQGGAHSPPPGYIARTIRPATWPDPNVGRLEHDREAQRRDALWKAYEPRWPKSADGQWFWKSDTSSDELDGHYFFYALYYDFCADTEAEKDRVREVVRGITDHLLSHDFVLIDHDGRPTRWAVYGPQFLNRDPLWWPERGLNSLSILSYLAVAAHVTAEAKYDAAARQLVEQHGYAHNAMYPKVQLGAGSGNQSDDEMAFMCYYTLLRCSKDESLKSMVRDSFFRYWLNEAPELNPFFNFAYAAQNLQARATNPWGRFSVQPWAGWHENSMATLYGFPLDRLDWPHHNSQRLDLVRLPPVRSGDVSAPDRHPRGHRVNGKVLPVENRHFNHWNTDPWELDYSGSATELGAGTVFLLPYYLGLYHGFIETPGL